MNEKELFKNILDSYLTLYPHRIRFVDEPEITEIKQSENKFMIKLTVKVNEDFMDLGNRPYMGSLAYLFDILSVSILIMKNVMNSATINLDMSYDQNLVCGEKLHLAIYCEFINPEYVVLKLEAKNQDGITAAIGTHNILIRNRGKI